MDKVNILVVDDRPEGILAVQAVLDSPEYNIISAHSGNEALRQLLAYDFAVILMDVQMPIMNGFETASIIKTREKSRDIPIIFMSAINQDQQYVYQGYSVGAVDYLLKPFDPYILRSKVSIFVDIFRKKKLIQDQAAKIFEAEKRLHTQELDRLEFESLRRYQTLADSIPHMVFRMNVDGHIEYFNKGWFDYTGLHHRTLSRFNWADVIHKDDLHNLQVALSGRNYEERDVECRIVNRYGVFRWHLIRIQPEFMLEEFSVKSWLGTATDIEDRKRDEMAQKFLSDAGEVLVSTLDPIQALDNISKTAIPYLADWCAFDLFNDNEEVEKVIINHRDENDKETAQAAHKEYFLNPDNSASIYSLLHSKEKYHVSECEYGNFISVLLCNKDKVFGVMTFVATVSGRSFSERDVATINELGKRVGLALENASLYKISQDAIEARNDFLSIASHELNTPITSLKLQLQMIKKADRKSVV